MIDLLCYEVETGVPIRLAPARYPLVLIKCERCGVEDKCHLSSWAMGGPAQQLIVVNVITAGIRYHAERGWVIHGSGDLCPGCAQHIRQRDEREAGDLLCEDEREFVEGFRRKYGRSPGATHLLDIIDRLAPRPGDDE